MDIFICFFFITSWHLPLLPPYVKCERSHEKRMTTNECEMRYVRYIFFIMEGLQVEVTLFSTRTILIRINDL